MEIDWGGSCAVSVTDENSECVRKKEIVANIEGKLKIASSAGGLDSRYSERKKEKWSRMSMEIFGDVLLTGSGEYPQTLDGALAMMKRKIRQLLLQEYMFRVAVSHETAAWPLYEHKKNSVKCDKNRAWQTKMGLGLFSWRRKMLSDGMDLQSLISRRTLFA